LAGGNLPPARLPGALWSEQGALRGAGPGQPLAAAELGLASPAHARSTEGPLILCDRTAHGQEPLLMGSVPQGTLDKRNSTAALGECIDHEPRRYSMAG
jgi:hypothetical protein